MKLDSVMTRATSGTFDSRAAMAFGLAERRRQHLDRVGVGVRIAAEIEIGRDRFRLRVAQIDRIEVEPQPIEQRQAGDHHQRGADDDRDALALEKSSTGASEEKPSVSGSPGGLSRRISAGSTVTLVTKAISMPKPAIRPSSETPR